MLGCVIRSLRRRFDLFFLANGVSIHIVATLCFLIDSIAESFSIFCNAEIIAFLSLVSSTLHASAKNSLFLDTANLISGYIRYHKIINQSQIQTIASHAFQLSLDDLIRHDPLNNISHTVDIIHTNVMITAINNTSLFIICVSSCHATASSSFLSSLFISHLENTIRAFFCCRHVANAFILSSSITHICGIGSHLDIHRFSTILYILGLSFLIRGLAPVNLKINLLWIEKDMINQIVKTTKIQIIVSCMFGSVYPVSADWKVK